MKRFLLFLFAVASANAAVVDISGSTVCGELPPWATNCDEVVGGGLEISSSYGYGLEVSVNVYSYDLESRFDHDFRLHVQTMGPQRPLTLWFDLLNLQVTAGENGGNAILYAQINGSKIGCEDYRDRGRFCTSATISSLPIVAGQPFDLAIRLLANSGNASATVRLWALSNDQFQTPALLGLYDPITNPNASIPEPTTASLLGGSLGALALARWVSIQKQKVRMFASNRRAE